MFFFSFRKEQRTNSDSAYNLFSAWALSSLSASVVREVFPFLTLQQKCFPFFLGNVWQEKLQTVVIHIFFLFCFSGKCSFTSCVCVFGNRVAEYTANNTHVTLASCIQRNLLTSTSFFCLCVSFCLMELRTDDQDKLQLHFLGYQGDGWQTRQPI